MYWEISRLNWLLRCTSLVYFNFVKIGTVQFVQCCCRSMHMVNCCALGLQCFSHLRFLGKDYSLNWTLWIKRKEKRPATLLLRLQTNRVSCRHELRFVSCCFVRIWRFLGGSEPLAKHADHSYTMKSGGNQGRSLSGWLYCCYVNLVCKKTRP